MQFFRTFRRAFALLTTTVFLSMSFQAPAGAAMIGSEQIAMAAELEGKRAEIQTLVAREDVARALLGYGVDPSDVEQRVANLSDAEVLQIHDRLDEVPAGGVLGAIIAILVIFMLLDMAGVTDIFPRI